MGNQRCRDRLKPHHGLALQDDGRDGGPERPAQQLDCLLVEHAEGRVQVMQDRPGERGQGGRGRPRRPAGQVELRITGGIPAFCHALDLPSSNSYCQRARRRRVAME